MKTLKIYGSSDDLIETSGIRGCDEFCDCSNADFKGVLHIKSSSGQMRINCLYDNEGCWSFAPAQVKEGEHLPSWTIRMLPNPENNYSTWMEIDCPDDSSLKYVSNSKKK